MCLTKSDCGETDLFQCVENVCVCSPRYGFMGEYCLVPTTVTVCSVVLYLFGGIIAFNALHDIWKLLHRVKHRISQQNGRKRNSKTEALMFLFVLISSALCFCCVQVLLHLGNETIHEVALYIQDFPLHSIICCISLISITIGFVWLKGCIFFYRGCLRKYAIKLSPRKTPVQFITVILFVITSLITFLANVFEIFGSRSRVYLIYACLYCQLSATWVTSNSGKMLGHQILKGRCLGRTQAEGIQIRSVAQKNLLFCIIFSLLVILQMHLKQNGIYWATIVDILLVFSVLQHQRMIADYARSRGKHGRNVYFKNAFVPNTFKNLFDRHLFIRGTKRHTVNGDLLHLMLFRGRDYDKNIFSRANRNGKIQPK